MPSLQWLLSGGTHLMHFMSTQVDLSTHLSPRSPCHQFSSFWTQSAIHFASLQESMCTDTKLMSKWTSWNSTYRKIFLLCCPCLLNCNPPTSSISIRRELLRASELQSPNQFYSIRICVLTRSWIGSYVNIKIWETLK